MRSSIRSGLNEELTLDHEVLDIADRVQLLLDDNLLGQPLGANLRRVLHTAAKHPDNPLIRADRPYESPFGPQLYGTVLPDGPGGELRMWYQSRRGAYLTLATSPDGVHWDKPELGLCEYEGSRANNIIVDATAVPQIHMKVNNPSVVLDPSDPDPQRRYKMFYYDRYPAGSRPGNCPKAGLFLAISPDGLDWRFPSDRAVMHQLGDVPDVVWDPIDKLFVSHNKLNHWSGDEVNESGRRTGRRIDAFVMPRGWRYGNGGPTELFGPSRLLGEQGWLERRILLDGNSARMKRAVGRAESRDGVDWSDQEPIFWADRDGDPPDLQYHGMPAWRVGDVWIGLLQVMREVAGSGNNTPTHLPTAMELAWSRDDHTWHRFAPGQPILPLGHEGMWDAGRIDGATHPVALEDQEYYLYAACPLWCLDKRWRQENTLHYQMGLASWRREGYVSIRSDGAAELLTRVVRWHPGIFFLNVDASSGSVRVELIDPNANASPPLASSRVLRTNETRAEVQWEVREQLFALIGRPVRIRFLLQNADLYSFGFEPGR